MLFSLLVFRRVATLIMLAAVGFSAVAPAATTVPVTGLAAVATSVAADSSHVSLGRLSTTAEVTPSAESDNRLLAHHESAISATPLLTAGATSIVSAVSKSLWGNMILSMAIQQDHQVQRIAKKLGRMSGVIFTSVGMISALGVAQGIDSLVTLQQDPHPYHPPILGLVGSGLTLMSVAGQAAMTHHYKKQLVVRQGELAHQVSYVLERLNTEGSTEAVKVDLQGLIGEQASGEFLGLWRAVHP
jgi:hypothetical protein